MGLRQGVGAILLASVARAGEQRRQPLQEFRNVIFDLAARQPVRNRDALVLHDAD